MCVVEGSMCDLCVLCVFAQRKDWPVHKGECVGMATSVHFPPDCIRLMLRLMMKKKEHFGKKPRAVSCLC